MKGLSGTGKVGRDWFGLDLFVPGARFVRDGSRLYLLDSVGSTNAFLTGRCEAATGRLCEWDGWGWKAGARGLLAPVRDPRPGTVVVAHKQTAGRGRQGRTWFDCGGLNLSVVVPSHRASVGRGFPVWLGLMVVLCLRQHYAVPAQLKWPNDILVAGRKVGGLLLERTGLPAETLVVAGLGLNLRAGTADFPPALQGVATSLGAVTGQKLRPAEIAGRLIAFVDRHLDRFDQDGVAVFRSELAEVDYLLGRTVQLVAGGTEYRGTAMGVDPGGRLLLKMGGGRIEPFLAGEVHLLQH